MNILNFLKKLPEFIRFAIVGVIATALHYGLYLLLQTIIHVNIAYTLGYMLSFIANFYLTAYFTFGSTPSWKKAIGFGGAQVEWQPNTPLEKYRDLLPDRWKKQQQH